MALYYSLDALDTLSTGHPEPSHSPHPPAFTALLQITLPVHLHHYTSLRPIWSLLGPGPESLRSFTVRPGGQTSTPEAQAELQM